MKTNFALLASAIVMTTSSMAFAGPAPMTAEELTELVDVVADVSVADTQCNGDAVEEQWGITSQYVSQLEVLEVVKGEVEGQLDYHVSSTEYDEEYGQPGCSSAEYVLPAGWVGRVYMTELEDGSYSIQYWGGAEKDVELSIVEEVPSCIASAPFDPSDPPQDPVDDDAGSVGAQGCSAAGGNSGNGAPSWLLALPLALALGARRRR